MRRRRTRGFSLIEMVTVLSVLGVAAATTVPYFMGMRARSELRSAARTVKGHLEEAKSLARTGRGGYQGWSDEDRVVQAGLRFTGPSTYELFVDANRRADGVGEEVVAVVRMGPRYLLTPSREQVRFRRNGTLEDPSPFTVELVDDRASLDRVLSVAFGGRVRVEE